MKRNVVLTISSTQYYPDQKPDTIELVTEGTLEYRDGAWDICYEETDLTGLEGVRTTFRLEPGQVTLERTGKLRSRMVFQEGVLHESLYQMELGVLMLTICAKQIQARITDRGGTVDLVYSIAVENNEAGLVEYHLDLRVKE